MNAIQFSKDCGVCRCGMVLLFSLFVLTNGASATDHYQEDFEAGLGGFVLDNSSGLGNGLWHRTDKAIASGAGHSATHILYYGLDDPCNYNLIDPVRGPMAHQGRAISPVIDLTGASGPLFLEFRYYLETENDPGYDLATVEISRDGGPYELLTGQRAGLIDPSGCWQKSVVNLSDWAGSSIQLRFGFNTVDDYANDFIGFGVDDVLIHDGSKPVYFEDDNLKAAIKEELGITTDPNAADMLNLTDLDAGNRAIADLTGIGYATNLRYLRLDTNQLSSLPPEIGNLTNLTRLDLWNNQLSSLPAEIGNLTKLTWLNLNNNQLSGMPVEIWNLTNLTGLYLYHNQLSSLPPEIGNLTNLTELWLYNNQLSSLPAEIGNLTNLLILWLHNNQLSSLPVEIWNLTNLTYLVLGNNQLSSLPTEIGNLTNLTRLHLYDNKLSTLPAEIGNLTNLMYLGLHRNQLSSLPTEFGNLTNLEWLDLYGNQLSSVPPEIWNLTKLRQLYLDSNQLSSLPSEIGNLTYLGFLYLDNNQLSCLPAEIGNLTYLKWLWLDNNQLNTLPAEIANLTNLTRLYLEGNQLNTEFYCGLRQVIEANNPGIDLRFDPNPNPWTNDCSTTLIELAAFITHWLDTGCDLGNNWCGGADLDHFNGVNLGDWAIFGGLWMKGP